MRLLLEKAAYSAGDFSLFADCEFREGIHLVRGPVGSGKSTFAALAAGLLRPDKGKRRVELIDRVMLSMQFPEAHVTRFTLGEEARSWGLDPEVALQISSLAGLEDQPVTRLSRGELKRFELTCALGSSYDLLILDEPFSALDCHQKQKISHIIERSNHGITIVITHESRYLPRVDRIWEMEGGRITDLGPVPQALQKWKSAPPPIRNLIGLGIIPANISEPDLLEAACGMQDSDFLQ